jgi:hypothetical protein
LWIEIALHLYDFESSLPIRIQKKIKEWRPFARGIYGIRKVEESGT